MIATTTSTAEYTGNASTVTTYAIGFPLADATDLVAIETVTATGVETTLDPGDFTFTPTTDLNGRITGGSVTTDPAIAATSTILFKRVTPKEQDFDLTAGGAFSAEALENVFDKLTMIAQEIARDFAAADAVLTAADVAIKARLDALEA
jgi:hypothetical protein